MKFRTRPREEPEINLIPFIDVLLVILIFLMLTTTYSKFNELQLQLPVASADATHQVLGGTGQWLLAMPAHHIAGADRQGAQQTWN